MDTTLRVNLFGQFQASYRGQPVGLNCAGRARELFCYLLLHPERAHGRETLAGILWGGVYTTEQARNYLRKALWQLQTGLTEEIGAEDAAFVEAAPVAIRIEAARVWTDAGVLENAYRGVEDVAGEALTPAQASVLEHAVALYRGDLLEDWYRDWCLVERERFHQFYLVLLDKLVGYCEVHQRYDAGLSYARRILASDGARERAHRQIMRLHHARGDRTGALRQYEQCVAALRDELGVAPGRRTTDLLARIRADGTPEDRHPDLGDDLDDLRRLQGRLTVLQGEVDRLARLIGDDDGIQKQRPRNAPGTEHDTSAR